MAKEDEETPVPPHRRSTGSITSWGIAEAWMSSSPLHRVEHRMGVTGHEVRVYVDTGIVNIESGWEPVRPNEDPSSAVVRAIGKLK